ncbi:hypothetical protein C6502_00150 [Candidatus Poribacteria bacterium]|nr:MAG: hypothetical protein C6502_00150 [Candidatus Poribacteria bacterium]
MAFPLPPINDPTLRKFCETHDLHEAVAAGYHYAHKFFPAAKTIEIDFYPPYRDDEPEEAEITFVIKSNMTGNETIEAQNQFIKAMRDVPGAFYIIPLHRFIR